MATTEAPETRPQTAFVPGAHLADPAALGLGGFALTTFVLSVVNAGWMSAEAVVFGLALAYGGLAQLLAGMWEFAKGNTFGATAFSSYGAFWLSFWYLTGHTDFGSLTASQIDTGVAWYLLAWGIFTLYMTVGATHTNTAVLTVFVLLTITYFVLAAGDFTGSSFLGHLGGYIGIATALAAWYASFATVANWSFKRTLLPVGPRA